MGSLSEIEIFLQQREMGMVGYNIVYVFGIGSYIFFLQRAVDYKSQIQILQSGSFLYYRYLILCFNKFIVRLLESLELY